MSTANETKANETNETKANETTAAVKMVEITIPRGHANDEPNVIVGVNGVNYLLPRGKKSKVPSHVADEIRRSWKAQETMDQHIDEMLEASK